MAIAVVRAAGAAVRAAGVVAVVPVAGAVVRAAGVAVVRVAALRVAALQVAAAVSDAAAATAVVANVVVMTIVVAVGTSVRLAMARVTAAQETGAETATGIATGTGDEIAIEIAIGIEIGTARVTMIVIGSGTKTVTAIGVGNAHTKPRGFTTLPTMAPTGTALTLMNEAIRMACIRAPVMGDAVKATIPNDRTSSSMATQVSSQSSAPAIRTSRLTATDSRAAIRKGFRTGKDTLSAAAFIASLPVYCPLGEHELDSGQ